MNLLGAINYDPSSAVSKATTSLLAMTAFDTTNLRIAFTVPAHGIVTVKMTCVHHGSTTTAQVLLGCLEGATVRGRAPVTSNLLGTAVATTRTKLEASFTLTGLTPGAVNWDAAYGVEIVASASGAIKYGGPNNTTTDDAWGGFNFEIWDPKPAPTNFSLLSIDANGRVDVIKVAGTTQTARDIGASVLLSSGTGTGQLDFTSGIVKANLVQILGTALTETAGQIAAGFKKLFNVAVPVLTAESVNQTGDAYARLGAPVGASISADVAAVQADTNDIQTRLPAALVSGRIDANVGAMASNTMTASALAADAVTEIQLGLATSTALATVQADTDDIQTRLPASLSGDGFIKADIKSIDDELTNGNNATLNLKQINIINNAGTALNAQSGGGDGYGIRAIGNGTGNGILAQAGLDGIGLSVEASNGNAVNISSDSNYAATITGEHGVYISSLNSADPALYLDGAGRGVEIYGQSNDGVLVQAELGGNGHGLNLQGDNTGKSINALNDIAVSDGDLTLAAIAQSVLKFDFSSITGEASRSVINALRKLRNKISFNGTNTLTIYKEDGTTSAYTQAVTSDSDQEPFKELGN